MWEGQSYPLELSTCLAKQCRNYAVALMGRPRGSGQRGRWEGGSGWGIHVNPWLIHVSVWQDPLQYCEIISLQLIKINEKIKKKEIMWWLLWRKLHVLLHLSPVPTTRLGTLLPGHHNIAQTELVCWGSQESTGEWRTAAAFQVVWLLLCLPAVERVFTEQFGLTHTFTVLHHVVVIL